MPKFVNSPVIQDLAGVWISPADRGATSIANNAKKASAEDVSTPKVVTNPEYVEKITVPDNHGA